jgi:L-seryl-tRNA(Ser) seleniumtransferase
MTRDVFESLGTRPVLNACGIYTDLGGSRLSDAVWAAMTEANREFVKMVPLLEGSGRVIAEHLGTEAALVTPGAAASIALMTAAALAGTDGAAGQRLPSTEGLKSRIILQHNHGYKYDRQIRLAGAELVLAGSAAGTSLAELEACLDRRTAALFVPAHLDGHGSTVPLDEVVRLGRRAGIPVLVDAAYLCWPLELMTRSARSGADLICFSAKYFGGPNAGGFVCGTRAMVRAVAANDFTGYESGAYRTFGRPLKMDRQTIVGVVAALKEWLALDHAARWVRYGAMVHALAHGLAEVDGLELIPRGFTMDERLVAAPVNALVARLGPNAPVSADALAARLEAGSPSVVCVVQGDRLIFCVEVLAEEEIPVLAQCIRRALAA